MSDHCEKDVPSVEAGRTDIYRITVPEDSALGGCVAGCVASAQLCGSCSAYGTDASVVRQITLDGIPVDCSAISELIAEKMRGAVDRDGDGSAERAPGHENRAGMPPVQPESRPIQIWIATNARAGLAPLLAHLDPDPDIHVGGICMEDLAGLADCARQQQPDVLLFDRGASGMGDLQYLQAVRAVVPTLRVLVLVDQVWQGLVEEILHHRLHGYLQRHCPVEIYQRAIRAVARGDIWVPRVLLARALADVLERADSREQSTEVARSGCSATDACTGREREILELVRRGLTNKEIARRLGIMEDTVKKHLQHVYDKLGVRRRTLLMLSEPRSGRPG